MRDTFARTLYEVAQVDSNVSIVVADISPAASMAPYRAAFPERFINVGVAEQSMISLCAGLAMRGGNPFAYTIAPFVAYRPFEHIRVELCYQNLPVTLVGVGAGVVYSVLGGTHNAIEDVAVMSALPNMSVIAPCDPLEVASAVWACAKHDGPVYLRLGKSGEPVLTEEAPEPFEFGKIRKIKDGSEVCIIGYGSVMRLAFDAVREVEKESSKRISIYSAHTIKPLDVEGIIDLLELFDKVIVLEEHTPMGSLGGSIKQIAWDQKSECQICAMSLKDEFIHLYGSDEDLLSAHGIDVKTILSYLLD
jgi:transketolase